MDDTQQYILDKFNLVFSGKLPLKLLMGFSKVYPLAIINFPPELILIITGNDRNCYEGSSDPESRDDITATERHHY